MAEKYLGNLIIVAAPSGGGKTSLVKKLIETTDNIAVSISHTTRPMRPGEQEGNDYFFIDSKQFETMIEQNEFVEHAQVFNHYYGTSLAQIKARLLAGIDVVLDIDWQGAQQIRALFPQSVSVFILPPSLAILQERLQNRGQDKPHIIEARMQQARDEMSHYAEFDYLIVNDNFILAAQQLQTIVLANRLATKRQSLNLTKLLSFLLAEE